MMRLPIWQTGLFLCCSIETFKTPSTVSDLTVICLPWLMQQLSKHKQFTLQQHSNSSHSVYYNSRHSCQLTAFFICRTWKRFLELSDMTECNLSCDALLTSSSFNKFHLPPHIMFILFSFPPLFYSLYPRKILRFWIRYSQNPVSQPFLLMHYGLI
jgi:hypothetical protein